MGKKKKNKIVLVPAAVDLDDDTFLKHMELRHRKDIKIEGASLNRHAMEAWVGSYRAFHERLHRIAVPGQYDHEHEEAS